MCYGPFARSYVLVVLYVFCTQLCARGIVRLSESMLDGCLLKEEIKENSIFACYGLTYIFIIVVFLLIYKDRKLVSFNTLAIDKFIFIGKLMCVMYFIVSHSLLNIDHERSTITWTRCRVGKVFTAVKKPSVTLECISLTYSFLNDYSFFDMQRCGRDQYQNAIAILYPANIE